MEYPIDLQKCKEMIANYMGYIYKEENVIIEDYEIGIGGMYNWKTVYSKTPILVDRFNEGTEYEQCYFCDLPNPDFGREKPVKWNNEIKTLSWASLNEYITNNDLDKYITDWNSIMKVIEKIEETNYVKIVGKFCGINKFSKDTFNEWASYVNKYNFWYEAFGYSAIDISTSNWEKILVVFQSVVLFIEWFNNADIKENYDLDKDDDIIDNSREYFDNK